MLIDSTNDNPAMVGESRFSLAASTHHEHALAVTKNKIRNKNRNTNHIHI